MSDKLIDACLTGINIAAKYEELFGMYQDQSAELTKLKADVVRLRGALQGCIDCKFGYRIEAARALEETK